jgi:hypothetical protein
VRLAAFLFCVSHDRRRFTPESERFITNLFLFFAGRRIPVGIEAGNLVMKRCDSNEQVAPTHRAKSSYIVLLVGVVLAIGLAALVVVFSRSGNEEFKAQTPNRGASRASLGSAWYRSSGQWLADVHTLAGMAHYLFEPELNFRQNFARLDNPAPSISILGETGHAGITNEQTKGWEPPSGRAIGTTVL